MLAEHSLFLYGGLLVLLLFVLFKGSTQFGAQRWIPIGPFNLQPSEFGRIGAGADPGDVLRREPARRHATPATWSIGGMFTAVPLLLIAKQPDLGTAVTLIPVFFGVAYPRRPAPAAARRDRAHRRPAGARSPGSSRSRTTRSPASRRSSIRSRIRAATGYQQIQARITVGSGGLTGKGFMKGTQGQYKFLPVAHNDFIFSVLAEEQGFIGVLAALGLYLFVILRSLEAARLAKDRLGAYLVGGIISGFSFQVIYNITMSAGLAPVKGITLPLMSYGGSSLIATLAAFGLILNVRMRRFTN